MRILGLTGDIAAGKSTVADLLQEKGAVLLDADALVHELYADPAFAKQVSELFEAHFWDSQSSQIRSILDDKGGIDRAALGTLVFRDAAALRKLEALVHPAVAELRARKIQAFRDAANPPIALVLEAVKLIESGQNEGCDGVWWVRATPETQLRRLMENRNLDENAARARLANQPHIALKLGLAAVFPVLQIDNDGTLDELKTKVDIAWDYFLKNTPAKDN